MSFRSWCMAPSVSCSPLSRRYLSAWDGSYSGRSQSRASTHRIATSSKTRARRSSAATSDTKRTRSRILFDEVTADERPLQPREEFNRGRRIGRQSAIEAAFGRNFPDEGPEHRQVTDLRRSKHEYRRASIKVLMRLLPVGSGADVDNQRHVKRRDARHQSRQLGFQMRKFGIRNL